MAHLQDMKENAQAGTNALAKRAAHPITGKTDFLDKRKDLLGAGLPSHMMVEREIRTATVMLMQSKELQAATPQSFYTAVSIAVNSGIGLGNGKGYLVAYKGNVSYVPGWKGLVDLVSRTGRASIWTGVVHKGDHFKYALGDSPFCEHRPGDNEDHKDITHYYAIGRVKGSEWPVVEVWSVNKVIKHLNQFNKVGGKHYALKDDNNMEMYSRKVVLLQALKYLPQSQDLENAIAAETAHEAGKHATIEGNFVYIDEDGAPLDQAEEEQIPRTDHQAEDKASANGIRRESAETVEVREAAKPASQAPLTVDGSEEYETLAVQLQRANSLSQLADLYESIGEIGNAELRAALTAMYKQRYTEFKPANQATPAEAPAPAKRTRRGTGSALE